MIGQNSFSTMVASQKMALISEIRDNTKAGETSQYKLPEVKKSLLINSYEQAVESKTVRSRTDGDNIFIIIHIKAREGKCSEAS